MATLLNISEGRTKRLVFFFETKAEGSSDYARQNLTGITVTFGYRRGPSNDWVEAPGTVTKDADQSTYPGKFYYAPASADEFAITDGALKETFYARAIGTDGDGKLLPAPSGMAAEIVVHKK